MKFKKLVENWNNYTSKEVNEVIDADMRQMMDDIAVSQGLGSTESDISRDIMINGGARLDFPGIVDRLYRDGYHPRLAEDPQFLVAWITGRLQRLGGPSIKQAKQRFGDHTRAKLFSKYKNMPTKYDKKSSAPQPRSGAASSSAQQASPSTPPARERASRQQILRALKATLNLDYSQGLDIQTADRVMSIIATAVDSLERES
jgi:hypothetical protein